MERKEYNIHALERETLRKGKLIAVKIKEDGKHPTEWDWCVGNFGHGERTYAIFKDGLFHKISINYKDWYKMYNVKNPKKIRATLYENKYEKREQWGFSWLEYNHFIELDNIYKLCFEDDITKLKFENYYNNILNVLQPNTDNDKCIAYWSYNPIAVFGTVGQNNEKQIMKRLAVIFDNAMNKKYENGIAFLNQNDEHRSQILTISKYLNTGDPDLVYDIINLTFNQS